MMDEEFLSFLEGRRKDLYDLLGILPARDLPVTSRLIRTEESEDYVTEYLILDVCSGTKDNPDGEPIPAYFIRPKTEGPHPAILFSHSHGGLYHLGKDEIFHPAPYMYPEPYAKALTKMGLSILVIDHWCFGERSGRSESDCFKDMLWNGRVMFGCMVYDSLKALDYLASRPDVDASRIGALGMSMGATMSWWIAALDKRIRFCVDICCFTDYDALIEDHGLSRHGLYYYVPGLLNHFSSGGINSLIAPRRRFATVGLYDDLNPVSGIDRMEKELIGVYHLLDADDNFRLLRCPCGHRETAEMREAILSFIRESI